MKKVAVILTNIAKYATKNEATGLWLAEATEFVAEMERSGIEVDYISPRGGYVPIDPRSLKEAYIDDEVLAVYQSEDFQRRALAQSLPVSQVKAEDYWAVYYTGGHGVVWDFPNQPDLIQFSQDLYAKGGYITAVCHGLAGLLNLKDQSGQYLLANKKVTGFTNMEEVLSGKSRLVPFSTETEAVKRGAHMIKKIPFTSHAIQDGRLITGQNPMSGRAVAKLLVEQI